MSSSESAHAETVRKSDACLSESELRKLAVGGVIRASFAESQAHFDACESCRRSAAEMQRAQEELLGRSQFMDTVDTDDADGFGVPTPLVSPGDVLASRWHILEKIGQGGFGTVYSARDMELEVTVAIKVLRTEAVKAGQEIHRFKQEILLSREVTHKNVCRVFDVGFHTVGELRVPFLSMELIDGVSLDRIHRVRSPLPLEEIEDITLQVIAGLEAAHEAGIVHADLKPANIMMVGEGSDARVVITDFGLATAFAGGEESNAAMIVGTPAYMAPEQAKPTAVGPAADYYALGCTLFELIAGRLPFVEKTALATARARLKGDPPTLDLFVEDVPTRWNSLVRQLMTVDPDTRLADASKLRNYLNPPQNTKKPRLALVIALLVSLALVAVLLLKDRESPLGEFTLSAPSSEGAQAAVVAGQKAWQDFREKDALAIYEKAIAAGHTHVRILQGRCLALAFPNGKQKRACSKAVFEAASSLSADDSNYYEARYRSVNNEYSRATTLLLGLLKRYPGNTQLVLDLAWVQQRLSENEEALRTLANAKPQSAVEKLQIAIAQSEVMQHEGRFEESLKAYRELLTQARELGELRSESKILHRMTEALLTLGQLPEARSLGELALKLSRRVQSVQDESRSLGGLISTDIRLGYFKSAMKHADTQEALLLRYDDEASAQFLGITKAQVLSATGRGEEAEKALSSVILPRLRVLGATRSTGYGLVARALVRESLLQSAQAQEDCFAAVSIFRGMHSPRMTSYAQLNCAKLLLQSGDISQARGLLETSRELRKAAGLELLLLDNSLIEAEAELLEGAPRLASKLADAVASSFDSRDMPMHSVTAREVQLRAALAIPDALLAQQALDAALLIGPRENLELDLQLRFSGLRLAALSGDSVSAADGLAALHDEAQNLGYLRIAAQIEKSVGAILAEKLR